jgi:CHAT domain-containing protein
MSNPAISKAEALRQAQLGLLTGRMRGAASGARGTSRDSGLQAFARDPQKPYAHPYFWAPFVLMGNWK